ncbi:MAG: ATP synthase F1 subunit delta [Chitinophagales bacterium]|nr:ATP synthase F1 subunit delta [Chitinophagales bacterium]
MLSPRLASRYAKSLMLIARENKVLDAVSKDLHLLKETLDSSKDLRIMFKSPVIPSDKKEKVIHALFAERLSDVTYSFINLLTKKGREKHLVEMVDSFLEQYNKEKNIVTASLTTAVPVGEESLKQVRNLLMQSVDTKAVELSAVVDENIIGGFVLKYGDLLLDNSVERKLQLIKKQIQDTSYIPKI